MQRRNDHLCWCIFSCISIRNVIYFFTCFDHYDGGMIYFCLSWAHLVHPHVINFFDMIFFTINREWCVLVYKSVIPIFEFWCQNLIMRTFVIMVSEHSKSIAIIQLIILASVHLHLSREKTILDYRRRLIPC